MTIRLTQLIFDNLPIKEGRTCKDVKKKKIYVVHQGYFA